MSIYVRAPFCARPTISSTTRPFTSQRTRAKATVYHVELEHAGKTYNLDVPAGQTILDVATEKYKLDLPYGQYSVLCLKTALWLKSFSFAPS